MGEINHLGPALLTEMLIPSLSKSKDARVVYLASERSFAYDWSQLTVTDAIAKATTSWDPVADAASRSYPFAKFLVIQYAAEQARRRPSITFFSVNPGYSALPSDHQWPLIIKACGDYIRMDPCPMLPQQGATSAVFAAGQQGIESRSGALIDFHTTLFDNGTYFQSGKTCVPRPLPGSWSDEDRSKWYYFVQSKISSLPLTLGRQIMIEYYSDSDPTCSSAPTLTKTLNCGECYPTDVAGERVTCNSSTWHYQSFENSDCTGAVQEHYAHTNECDHMLRGHCLPRLVI